MSYLIQIDHPPHLPMFVRRLHRAGAIAVTFDQAKARRFPDQASARLEQIRAAVAKWPQSGSVSYVPEVL